LPHRRCGETGPDGAGFTGRDARSGRLAQFLTHFGFRTCVGRAYFTALGEENEP